MRFQVQIEERLDVPRRKRWHAQFCFYPLGYFRGTAACPGLALAKAWKNFRAEIDPGERWWTAAAGAPPLVRY